MEAVVDAAPPAVERSDDTRLTYRQEMVTLLLGSWVMVGLFIDGWAHRNLSELETFFTPWHGLFYSGFVACAAWIGWQVLRRQESGHRGRAAVPAGYGLALVGLAVFALGGVGDGLWHTVLGIEEGLEALFSPMHLTLFVGLVLVLTAPLRAAWAHDVGQQPSLRGFLPVLLSAALVTSLVAFMTMFVSAFDGVAQDPKLLLPADDMLQVVVIAEVLATNLIVLAPLLVLSTRWCVPFGSATVLLTTVAVLSSALLEFAAWPLAAAGIGAGVVIDVLLRRLRPGPRRPNRIWVLGLLAPLPLWGAWFAAVAVAGDMAAWTLEVWTGTVLWAMVLGAALGLLIHPPLRRPPGAGATL